MKQGRALPDLALELERQANAKRDYLAPAGNLSVRSNGHTDLFVDDAFPVTDIAHGQMAEYLDVPKGFYDKLRGNTNELIVRHEKAGTPTVWDQTLFDVTVNTLLASKGPQKRLVRTLDGRARAFLSDSYNPDLDNFDVFRVAAQAIEQAGLGPDNVISTEVTESRMYVKVVSPKLEAVVTPESLRNGHGLLKEPQVVQAGFVLSNSETGLGSLRVSQMVYKLVCTNGWIREEAYRQRHVGRALEAEDDGTVYRSDTRLADAKARLLKVRDHVADALDEGRFRDLVGRMQETAAIRLESGAEKCVDATARKFGLTQLEKETVLTELIEGADLSLWGLTNAVTAVAQKSGSYDRATDLEAIGGRFFSLTKPEIKEIVSAS